MTSPPSAESFFESAQDFAATALEAHATERFRRVAMDAGTALEHLAKACLVSRSPALIVELRNETSSYPSLLRLLGLREGNPRDLRTVGLWNALERVRPFISSVADIEALRLLCAMRDGTVHAARDDEIEARLLVSFAQHADAMLVDLDRGRDEFWGSKLTVVDALLADASDKVTHSVQVKLANARAAFAERFPDDAPPELLTISRKIAEVLETDDESAVEICPVCKCWGKAIGWYDVEWEYAANEDGTYPVGRVFFEATEGFRCGLCGLRLSSAAEMAAAGLQRRWEIPELDADDFGGPPFDDDAIYEAMRDAQWEDDYDR